MPQLFMPSLPRLRDLRQREALTQEELPRKAGVTASTISLIESGFQEARASTVRKLADALGVKPVELMGGDNYATALYQDIRDCRSAEQRRAVFGGFNAYEQEILLRYMRGIGSPYIKDIQGQA